MGERLAQLEQRLLELANQGQVSLVRSVRSVTLERRPKPERLAQVRRQDQPDALSSFSLFVGQDFEWVGALRILTRVKRMEAL